MKLYYSPGACSLAPHIVLRELEASFELERVNLADKTTAGGEDFTRVNPLGYVPALELDSGELLTEGVAIMQYLADQVPAARLAPPCGTLARARLQEVLNYLAAELHKGFAPLFAKNDEAARAKAVSTVASRLDPLDARLATQPYLLGADFSVADAYLFVLASWTAPTGISLDKWPHIAAFSARVAERRGVREAMAAEGLL